MSPSDSLKGDEPTIRATTNAGMKQECIEKLENANKNLVEALAELSVWLSPTEQAALDQLQFHWIKYRQAFQEYARQQFNSGTNAALASVSAGITETERRVNEIREEISSRTSM